MSVGRRLSFYKLKSTAAEAKVVIAVATTMSLPLTHTQLVNYGFQVKKFLRQICQKGDLFSMRTDVCFTDDDHDVMDQ